jgi:fumarate reductase subunit D
MKRVLSAVLLFTLLASPSFAAKHPRWHHQHYDYRYHAPKYKAHHFHKDHVRHAAR